jgi:hypothetical protein
MGVPEVPVIRRLSRCARCAFSKRTASPALTAAVLAESPLANSISEREANDQGDSNFQHSDSAEADENSARANNTAQGRGPREPARQVPLGNIFGPRNIFGPPKYIRAPIDPYLKGQLLSARSPTLEPQKILKSEWQLLANAAMAARCVL